MTSTSMRSPRRVLVAVLSLALFLPALPAVAVEEPEGLDKLGLARDESIPHSQTHVLVRVSAPAQGLRTLGTGFEAVGHDWFEVPVPAGWEPIDWAREMATRPGVEVAELDLTLSKQATPPFISPDPFYSDTGAAAWQWHLHDANVGGAWQSTVGAGVTIAVLDTGVNDGTDGFCRPFVAEYNAVTDLAGPGTATDTDGHGSHVAGSVAQCSDNGFGGAGMAPEATIM
ncbi:MAG: S8 family serine peptidase, partial [Acidimicrobiia bacterium]